LYKSISNAADTMPHQVLFFVQDNKPQALSISISFAYSAMSCCSDDFITKN